MKHLILILFFVSTAFTSVPNPIINYIKSKEGLRLNAYYDAVRIPTIGYGSTANVKIGMKITKEQAHNLLLKDLVRFENYVNVSILRPMKWYERGSLITFSFNLGYRIKGDFKEAIETGNTKVVCYKINLYVNAGGVPLRGLIIRRKEESMIYSGNMEFINKYE